MKLEKTVLGTSLAYDDKTCFVFGHGKQQL